MLKKASGIYMILAVLATTGCEDKSKEQSCQSNGEDFFKSSIDSYYSRHDKTAVGRYALRDGSRYDTTNDWWVVPFGLDGKQYLAMISCDGHLELSLGRP